MGYLEGFYYNPRIDKQILREHSEGLIGLSACLGGEIAQTLEKHGVAAAEEVAPRVRKSIFGKGNFFLELHADTDWRSRRRSTASCMRDGEEARHPAGRDQRLPLPEPATTRAAHEVLMAIQTGKSLKDEKRLKHRVDSYFLKSPAEMDGVLQGRARGAGERRQSGSAVQRRVRAGRDLPAQVPGPRRR